MRWEHPKRIGPPRPDKPYRLVFKFLWTKKIIGNEGRWLERAIWHEVWKEWNNVSWWEPVKWVSKDELKYYPEEDWINETI